jgi:hypothetical protein
VTDWFVFGLFIDVDAVDIDGIDVAIGVDTYLLCMRKLRTEIRSLHYITLYCVYSFNAE